MADYRAAISGFLNRKTDPTNTASELALPSLSSSANPWASAPAGTKRIVVTFRVAGVTMRWDGNAATAGANGADYPVGTYEFDVNPALLGTCRAIQNGGTATGWVQYFG